MGDEREKVPHATDGERGKAPHAADGPDVEAHRHKLLTDDAPADDDDTPDVEAHRHKL